MNESVDPNPDAELPDDSVDGDLDAEVADDTVDHEADVDGATDEDSTSTAARAIDDVGAYIRQQRESAALSLRKLAKLAGVSNPYLSQIERGLRKPSVDILQGIAKALEISSETLYVKAGILDERDDKVNVEDAIREDGQLTDAQQVALIDMYRSFLSASQLRPVRRRPRRRLGMVERVAGAGASAGPADDDAQDDVQDGADDDAHDVGAD